MGKLFFYRRQPTFPRFKKRQDLSSGKFFCIIKTNSFPGFNSKIDAGSFNGKKIPENAKPSRKKGDL
ncbi:hypothetical protein HOLDEFILI_03787 [Holdemania filiformis DSM 12042]|uniref:Uncharacterized protein n=1 Tax=Holdemania filiformis DSM 12042 TaxID=545696 RepID=B9YD71_9FIRM|nr:hypothetical protein HOLDEFILI_03787 [Holdemania filiformis DSM 12042]